MDVYMKVLCLDNECILIWFHWKLQKVKTFPQDSFLSFQEGIDAMSFSNLEAR